MIPYEGIHSDGTGTYDDRIICPCTKDFGGGLYGTYDLTEYDKSDIPNNPNL